MLIPEQIIESAAEELPDGAWEPVFTLLTVDGDGIPRVCLLSRAELRFDEDGVRCVVRARRTRANLDRDPRATLVVVRGESAYYLRLSVRNVVSEGPDGGGTAVDFSADLVEEDTLHTPLRAMAFRSSEHVRQVERTDDNRALLDRLGSPGTSTGQGRT